VLDGGVAVVVADLAEVESPSGVDFEKTAFWDMTTKYAKHGYAAIDTAP
jgi:hypothetical protein